MADGHEGGEGIALARAVGLRFEEGVKKLRGIGDERLRVLEDRSDSPHGILADVGMAMFQTRTGRGKEGLDEFGLAQLGQEPKSITADIFVRVLKVVTNTVAVGRNVLIRWDHVPGCGGPYQTKIISCFNLPFESCFGQIS